MIDKNYLGHSLIIFNGSQNQIGIIYYCTKCESNILYTRYYPAHDWHYKMFNSNGWFNDAISCDEMIIKNIIE